MATLRLADVVAGLFLIADLSVGSEPEQAMRTCGLAVSLAERAGMSKEEGDEYYVALLEHVGCTGGAHEAAAYSPTTSACIARLRGRISPGDGRSFRHSFRR